MLDATQLFDGTLNTGLTAPTGAAITVTRDSTNVINWQVGRDMGAGAMLGLFVAVTQAFATLTSLDIEYQVSADNATYYTLLKQATIPVAQLIIGAPIFRYGVPLNQVFNAAAGILRAPSFYSKLVYTVNGSAATTGAVVAGIRPINDRDQTYIYNENYTTPAGI